MQALFVYKEKEFMENIAGAPNDNADARSRILDAAASLVADEGVVALTTRAVAAKAGVQAPTLYRLFGDKRGLLDAVAEHGMKAFVARKVAAVPDPDPVHDLRTAWDAYIAFGLEHPAVFAIMNEIGRVGPPSPATIAGKSVLHTKVKRIAQAGRLYLPEDRALALIHAAGTGVVATLLAAPAEDRDYGVAIIAREAVLGAILTAESAERHQGLSSLAVGLSAHLGKEKFLSPGERLLLQELLSRIANRPL